MKLYIRYTTMSFEEDNIEHNIIRGMNNKEFLAYDEMVEYQDDDPFIEKIYKKTYRKDKNNNDTEEIQEEQFAIKERDSWFGFPLYEFKDGEIIPFDYTKYAYFAGTKRRATLNRRIEQIYNPWAEAKIVRKTLKYIMDELKLNYPTNFSIMDKKIEEVINKNPKDKSK